MTQGPIITTSGSSTSVLPAATVNSMSSMERILIYTIVLIGLIPRSTHGSTYFNATLTSMEGDLSVTLFLPKSSGNNEQQRVFYEGARFEHGSMIGNIRRVVRDPATTNITAIHTLYGPELWRIPHNSNWPESGVGLASEFGAGEDGPLCGYRCGWSGASSVTNGVLGYKEARVGEPFLKIGVGVLVKGTCPECNAYENYLFNSEYKFAEEPQWTVQRPSSNTVVLEHEAILRIKSLYGYHLRKEISLNSNVLSVKSTLTNLGDEVFTTTWYSHHFFSCDGLNIGPGYKVELGLKPTPTGINMGSLYDEPGLMWWSTPVRGYAELSSSLNGDAIDVQMTREVEDGQRIKVEFLKDDTTRGTFVLKGCGTSIKEEIPEVADPTSGINMYAFNLYIERGTLSPEPLLLLKLEPGKSLSWTQVLEIDDLISPPPPPPPQQQKGSTTTPIPLPPTTALLSNSLVRRKSFSHILRPFQSSSSQLFVMTIMFVAVMMSAGYLIVFLWSAHNRRGKNYSVLSDVEIANCAE